MLMEESASLTDPEGRNLYWEAGLAPTILCLSAMAATFDSC